MPKQFKSIALVVPQHPDFYPHIERHAKSLLDCCDELHIISIFDSSPKLKLENTTFYSAMPDIAVGIKGFIKLMFNNYRLLKKIKPDFIEAIDPPSSIPVSIYAKKESLKWFYFSMEYFTQTPALTNKWLKRTIWGLAEKLSLDVNDNDFKIATVCRSVADCLENEFKRKVNVVRSIPWLNSVVTDSNFKRLDLREMLDIDADKFIIIYQGAIEEGRALLRLPLWIQKHKQVHFVVFGDGPLSKEFGQLIKSLDRISWMGRYPFDEMMDFSQQADAGVVWIEPVSESYRLSLPGKLFEYVHAGLVVLGSPLPEIKKHIEEYSLGEYAKDFSESSFDEALKLLIKNKRMYKRRLNDAKEILCWEEEQKKLIELIK